MTINDVSGSLGYHGLPGAVALAGVGSQPVLWRSAANLIALTHVGP